MSFLLKCAAALAVDALIVGSAYAQNEDPVCPHPDTHVLSEDKKTCVPKVPKEKAPPAEKSEKVVSNPANYVHDCIKPFGTLKKSLEAKGVKNDKVYVASQDGSTLRVLPAGKEKILGIFGCHPEDGEQFEITVDEIISSGSFRSGWVYGVMVAPFKFYPYSGEIAASATVGPYLGWRMDRVMGVSTTWVVSGGISSVTAQDKDEAGQPKSVQMTAWSGATGFIFEIKKGTNPFRAGMLVGKDWIDRKSSVRYENNARTWVALQLGYDWTDR